MTNILATSETRRIDKYLILQASELTNNAKHHKPMNYTTYKYCKLPDIPKTIAKCRENQTIVAEDSFSVINIDIDVVVDFYDFMI